MCVHVCVYVKEGTKEGRKEERKGCVCVCARGRERKVKEKQYSSCTLRGRALSSPALLFTHSRCLLTSYSVGEGWAPSREPWMTSPLAHEKKNLAEEDGKLAK